MKKSILRTLQKLKSKNFDMLEVKIVCYFKEICFGNDLKYYILLNSL